MGLLGFCVRENFDRAVGLMSMDDNKLRRLVPAMRHWHAACVRHEQRAAFLLLRGPFAWLGYGWHGCSQCSRPQAAPGAAQPGSQRKAPADHDGQSRRSGGRAPARTPLRAKRPERDV